MRLLEDVSFLLAMLTQTGRSGCRCNVQFSSANNDGCGHQGGALNHLGMTMFSVVIPYFKESVSVRRECIESICIAAAKCNDEVQIIEEYGGDGVSRARNRGISRAKGDWLLFVDSDDIVRENYFEEISKVINQNSIAQVIAWGENGEESIWSGLWNKAFRRDVLPLNGFRHFSHGEDRLFIAEVLVREPQIVKLDKQLYIYRPGVGSVTKQTRDLSWVIDTLGYSGELLDVYSRANENVVPKKLYHDIAVWVLEECAYALRCLSQREATDGFAVWREFLPRIASCKEFSYWHRFVAKICWREWRFGVLLCLVSRRLKRLLV